MLSGYSTGSIIKQQKDRRNYIDDFYSTHAPSTGAIEETGNGNHKSMTAQLRKEAWSSQRAHSLPDVLNSKRDDNEPAPMRSNLVRNNNNGRKNYHVRFDLIAEDAKNYHRPSLPNHVVGLRRAQSARRNVTTRSTDNLLC